MGRRPAATSPARTSPRHNDSEMRMRNEGQEDKDGDKCTSVFGCQLCKWNGMCIKQHKSSKREENLFICFEICQKDRHCDTNAHTHTVSQYLSTSRCVHVSGWQVPHSVDSNGHQTSLRSPARATALLFHLISSTSVCLTSKKTCICSHEIHVQRNRCMWRDTHETTLTPQVFFAPSVPWTHSSIQTNWFIWLPVWPPTLDQRGE